MTKSELIKKLRALDWGDDKKLRDRVLKSVGSYPVLRRGGKRAKPGSTKIGGKPDLPAALSWPGEDLVFVAQINLAECAPADKSGLLPRKGMLYFFAAEDEGSHRWHSRPAQVRVLYHEGKLAGARPVANPNADTLDCGEALQEHGVVAREGFETVAFEHDGVSDRVDRLLGWDRAEKSRLLPKYHRFQDEDAKDDAKEVRGHVLLLQVSGEDLERQGDTHSIYGENALCFFIKTRDLERGRFGAVKLWVGGGS
jgi:uncharacterized protein YwqG